MSLRLMSVALLIATGAQAQTAAEIADWLRAANAKVNSQAPTPELVAKAYAVDFSQSKEKLVTADLAKLKGISGLREVNLGQAAGTDANVAEVVKAVPNLQTLKLFFSPVTDGAFEHIGKLSNLQELALNNCKVTDAAMVHLAKLPKLARLTLTKTAVTEAGLETLKGAPIVSLVFDDLVATRKGMAAIAAMPKLDTLQLQFAKVDAEFAELEKTKTLKELTVMASTMTDVGAASLGKIKTLERLFIWDTRTTDKAMASISGLPLKVLYVDKTGITDAGMKSLAKISTLETLWLNRTAVTDKGLAALAKHPTLRWVQADETKVTDKAAETAITINNLDSFSVRKTGFTEAGEKKIKEKLPKARVYR